MTSTWRGILFLLITLTSVLFVPSEADAQTTTVYYCYNFQNGSNNSSATTHYNSTCDDTVNYSSADAVAMAVQDPRRRPDCSSINNGQYTERLPTGAPVFTEQGGGTIRYVQPYGYLYKAGGSCTASGSGGVEIRIRSRQGELPPVCAADKYFDAEAPNGIFGGTICANECSYEPRLTLGLYIATSGGNGPSKYAVRSTGVPCTGDTAGVMIGSEFEEGEYQAPPPTKVDCVTGSNGRTVCLSEQSGCGYVDGEQFCADVDTPKNCGEVNGQQVCADMKSQCGEVNGVEYCTGTRPDSQCGLLNGKPICTGGELTNDRPCVTTETGGMVCLSSAPTNLKPDTGTEGQPAAPDAQLPVKDEGQSDGERTTVNHYNSSTVQGSSNYGDGQGDGDPDPDDPGSGGGDPGGGDCDPETEDCGGGGGSLSGGDTCDDPPTCDGDPIGCYVAKQEWNQSCAYQIPSEDLVNEQIDEGFGTTDQGGLLPVLDEINVSDWFTQATQTGSGGCFNDISIYVDVTDSTINLPLSQGCAVVYPLVRAIFLIMASLWGLRHVAGAF